MNNQGLEMVVSTRSVAAGQNTMNVQILQPFSASLLQIEIEELEYYYEYNVSEEQDIQAEKERESTDIANHRQLQDMGFEIYKDSDGKLYSKAPVDGMPVTPQQQEQQGMFGEEEETKLLPEEAGGDGNGRGKPFANVEGMNEDGQSHEQRAKAKPFQGAPSEPQPKASGLTSKSATYLQKLYSDITTDNIAENGIDIHFDYFGWLKPIMLES